MKVPGILNWCRDGTKNVTQGNELQRDARRVLERLLNGRLAEDDRVAVVVLPAGKTVGDAAWRRLEKTLDRFAARANGAADAEIETAINEAMRSARQRKR